MMFRRFFLVVSAAAVVGFARFAPALEPGDPAPALKVARWISGEPVSLAAGRNRNVFVIEFWSSASGLSRSALPHLAEVQTGFADRDVVCIAVSSERPRVLREFVEQLDQAPAYRVAADRGKQTFRAYMEASGIRGLPHAFIVDREGRIAWHGHPLDDLERVLQAVLAEDARRLAPTDRPSSEQLLEELTLGYVAENWDQVLKALDQLIERDPNDRRFILAKVRVMVGANRDVAGATQYGLGVIDAHRDDAAFLNEIAWSLLTTEDYTARCMELAYEAALAADRASDSGRSDISDTLARALYQIGRLDEAIRTQERALHLAEQADAAEQGLDQLRNTLRYYRDCAATRDKPRTKKP